MRRALLRNVTFALALTLAPAASLADTPAPAPAPVRAVTWGFETWQCGDQWFDIRLGAGDRDVWIDRIEGVASGVSGSNADPAKRWVRAALVTLTPGDSPPPADGGVNATPQVRAQHAVAGNLLSVILKQRGDQFVSVPVSQTYLGPQLARRGRLRALVDTQTYTGDAGRDALVPRNHPEECLDTEVQLVVQFHEASPAG